MRALLLEGNLLLKADAGGAVARLKGNFWLANFCAERIAIWMQSVDSIPQTAKVAAGELLKCTWHVKKRGRETTWSEFWCTLKMCQNYNLPLNMNQRVECGYKWSVFRKNKLVWIVIIRKTFCHKNVIFSTKFVKKNCWVIVNSWRISKQHRPALKICVPIFVRCCNAHSKQQLAKHRPCTNCSKLSSANDDIKSGLLCK